MAGMVGGCVRTLLGHQCTIMTSQIDGVLMLTNALSPDKLGGLERYVRELSAHLVAKGVPVTVLTKQVHADHPLEEIGSDGVRIVRQPVPDKSRRTFALQYPAYVALGTLRHTRGLGPGWILHGHYALTSLPLVTTRRPYLYTFHAPVHKEILSERGDTYALPRPVQSAAVAAVRTAERFVVARATRSITLSRFMRSELAELSATAAARSEVVAGGIDTDWFCPGPKLRSQWAAPAAPLLFTARRLTGRTGVSELVEAMPEVLVHHPQAQLAIAGDGHLRDIIDRRIRQLGLDRSVVLLGRISDVELRDWYRAADLVVTPTQELEGFGLSTAEALAVGTPVLVTPIGANPELVRELDPQLVAEGSSSADLARGICQLVDQPALLERVRRDARAWAETRWSWDRVVDRHLELYRGQVTP